MKTKHFTQPGFYANSQPKKSGWLDDYDDSALGYENALPEMGNGGYTVTRSSDRKGKTHKVTGPDGTVKYFGDSKLGQHPSDPARKKAFYARHKSNLEGNPFFRAFARKTWEEGGIFEMQKGGDWWNTNKKQWVDSVNNANVNKIDFVQRFFDPNYGSVPTPRNVKGWEPGQRSTHLMAYDPGSRRVYPEVVNVNGKLQYMPGDKGWNYADDTKQFIEFPTAEQAEWYAGSKDKTSGYKMGTNVLTGIDPKTGKPYVPKKANGGGLLSKTVTCSSCGWSWKAVDGGIDPITCHKCGDIVKMQSGGSLPKYQGAGWVQKAANAGYSCAANPRSNLNEAKEVSSGGKGDMYKDFKDARWKAQGKQWTSDGITKLDFNNAYNDSGRIGNTFMNADYVKYFDPATNQVKLEYSNIKNNFSPAFMYYQQAPGFNLGQRPTVQQILDHQKSQPSGLEGYQNLVKNDFFVSPPIKQMGGGLLSRTVTCSSCGWSWKAIDGGADPMSCHKCGGTIKMQEGGWLDQYDEQQYEKGGEMIRRADGSYSRRGLWDNIRANKGSGNKPTKQMLEQERKITAEKKKYGGASNSQQSYFADKTYDYDELQYQKGGSYFPKKEQIAPATESTAVMRNIPGIGNSTTASTGQRIGDVILDTEAMGRFQAAETKEALEKIYKTVRPSHYGDVNNYFRFLTNNQREEFDDPRSEEAFKQYLGLNSSPKYLSVSNYKPTINASVNSKYYKVDPELENDIFNAYKDKVQLNKISRANENNVTSEFPEGTPMTSDGFGVKLVPGDENMLTGRPMKSNARMLGQFAVSKGKDQSGEYLSYSDQYDFPYLIQNRMKGNPYKIYGRVYYPKKEKGGAIVSAEGYKQGPPPKGSFYRIPSNTLYNPTPYSIKATSNNGITQWMQPFDNTNVIFPGADYVDEQHYPQANNWLKKYNY